MRKPGKPAIDLLEEALEVLRCGGSRALLCYYFGTIPFVLALLYFWAEMSAGAFAEDQLAGDSLAVAVVFVWMRCWQSIFAERLLDRLGIQEAMSWTAGRVWRLLVQQTAVHASALFLLPVALIVALPFGWVYAFYQNFLLDGGGEVLPLASLARRSAEQAKLWPGQNHAALAFLILFGGVVFVNVLLLLLIAPALLKTLFGVETLFSMSGFSMFNTTVLMIAVGITHLIVDPLCKTFYIVRCFYGRSVRSGDDLKVAIRHSGRSARTLAPLAMSLAIILAFGTQSVPAADSVHPGPSIPSTSVNESIERVLARPEFAWRMPRVKSEESRPGMMTKFGDTLHDLLANCWKAIRGPLQKWWKVFLKWLEEHWKIKPSSEESHSGAAWKRPLESVLYCLCGLILVCVGIIGWRAWKGRGKLSAAQAVAVHAAPDLSAEHVSADQLPEERWLELGEELMAQGEFRLSLRAFYLAGLAHLGLRELITITRAKSNKEFRLELSRRARAQADLVAAFGESVNAFESAWYGTNEVTREAVARYTTTVRRIREC